MAIPTFDPNMPADVGDEFSIPGCRGLRFRIGVSSRTWFMRYRQPGIDGKLKEGKLGEWPAMSLVQAMGRWEERRALLLRGEDPFHAERQARDEKRSQREEYTRTGLSVERMAEEWMVGHCDKTVRGWETRRMLTQEFAKQQDFANRQADNLRLADVASFLEKIVARGAPRIAGMVRQSLGAAFEWCAGKGLVSDVTPNQFKRVMKGDKRIGQKRRDRVLTESELALLVGWLPESGMSENIKTMFECILRTGMRPGEVASMEWRHVDLKRGVYELPGSKTKTGLGRDVQLSHQVVDLLTALKDDEATFVFELRQYPSRELKGKPLSPKALTIGFRGAKIKWPGEHFTPHDLRRTCRTTLARLGAPMEVGELCLGHAVGGGVAETYNRHRYLDEQREWLQKMNNYLDTLKR